MKSTFTVLFYIRKDKQKKNGNSPIHCRITLNGQSTQFNTKAEIHSEQWDASAGKAKGRSPNVQEINSLLDHCKATLFRIFRELQERCNDITSEKIKNVFLGADDERYTLLQVFTQHNDNAVAESFFRSLKCEMIYGNLTLTVEQMELEIFEYIEIWYNKKRRHSALDNLTIDEFWRINKKSA